MKKEPKCKLCGSTKAYDFFQLPPVPTMDGVMCSSEAAAKNISKGEINLRFCMTCGFINNNSYDAAKINFESYDFSNDHSPLFRKYNNDLCHRLVETYDLHHKTVLDIGCGDGIFLKTICGMGGNEGVGIDIGFDHSKDQEAAENNISFIRDYYSEKYDYLEPDFVACRLVIDLLEDQVAFIKTIRANLKNSTKTVVYCEVPNATYTFKDKIFWNVVYEHKAWFTAESLAHLFEICGFEVLRVAPCWNDEFLGIEARPRAIKAYDSDCITAITKTLHAFSEDFQGLVNSSEDRIKEIQQKKIKTIAWGAGARAVTFFNLFDLKEDIPFIVDINTKRQGKYLPGSGHEIVAPAFAVEYQPELVVITNPTYAEEIKGQIAELGLAPNYWVL